MTPVAWTSEDLEARVARSRLDADTLRLSGASFDSREVEDLVTSLGLEELVLEGARVTTSASQVTVAGKANLFFIDGITATATFAAGEALSVSLSLEFPADVRIDVPFIKVGLGRLTVTASVSGPSLDVPVATIVLGGELTFDGHAVPVTLTPGARGFTLRAGPIRLPTLGDIASLLGHSKDAVAGVIPPGLADLGGCSIAEFVCELDPDRWAVSSISATIETDANGDWPFPGVPFVVLKKPMILRVGVEFPPTSGEDGEATGHQDKSPILTGSITAEMKIGNTLTLPVRVAREGDGWRVGVLSASGFPTVGELIGLMADRKVADALPAAMSTLGIDSSTVEVTIPDAGDVSVAFDARLKDHWKIIDEMVEVENARLQVHVGADSETSGSFAGTVRFGAHGEVAVPIVVQRSAESSSWTLRLACSGRELPGASSLTRVAGGVALPSDLPALDLSEFTVVFGDREAGGARKTEVQSIVLNAGLKAPWSPPGLRDFGVREAALAVNVERPGDEAGRQVTAALLMTLDVAAVPVPIVAKWESSQQRRST